MYEIVKTIHIICALTSISWFAWRGARRLIAPLYIEKFLLGTIPHFIDTALLASALFLVYLSPRHSVTSDWVTAKIVALIVYIGLGIASKRTKGSTTMQAAFYLMALAAASYIVAVAISKSPTPYSQ